jgi:hypothetical protein
METTAPTKSTEINAIVYPLCECGKTWPEHGDCGGYTPSTPVLNYGTVAFSSADPLANLLWKLESFFQRLRKRRVRSL